MHYVKYDQTTLITYTLLLITLLSSWGKYLSKSLGLLLDKSKSSHGSFMNTSATWAPVETYGVVNHFPLPFKQDAIYLYMFVQFMEH